MHFSDTNNIFSCQACSPILQWLNIFLVDAYYSLMVYFMCSMYAWDGANLELVKYNNLHVILCKASDKYVSYYFGSEKGAYQ